MNQATHESGGSKRVVRRRGQASCGHVYGRSAATNEDLPFQGLKTKVDAACFVSKSKIGIVFTPSTVAALGSGTLRFALASARSWVTTVHLWTFATATMKGSAFLLAANSLMAAAV